LAREKFENRFRETLISTRPEIVEPGANLEAVSFDMHIILSLVFKNSQPQRERGPRQRESFPSFANISLSPWEKAG
jgi:hypothetical protein